LIHNSCAASPIFGNFFELADEAWKAILETKCFGYIRCMREVLPHMIKQGDGRIVNISGVAGVVPNPGHLPGGSVNAALNLVTQGLALEMAKHNIRVNSVLLGLLVATERYARLAGALAAEKQSGFEAVSKAYAALVLLQRLAQPKEIADLVVFLASDRSSYITGACLIADGGRSLAYSPAPGHIAKGSE